MYELLHHPWNPFSCEKQKLEIENFPLMSVTSVHSWPDSFHGGSLTLVLLIGVRLSNLPSSYMSVGFNTLLPRWLSRLTPGKVRYGAFPARDLDHRLRGWLSNYSELIWSCFGAPGRFGSSRSTTTRCVSGFLVLRCVVSIFALCFFEFHCPVLSLTVTNIIYDMRNNLRHECV